MDKIEKFKSNFKGMAKKVAKAVKTGVSSLIDTAEQILKYYDAHKSTLNRLGLAALSAGALRFGFRTRSDDPRYMTREDREKRFYDNRMGQYVYARRRPNSYEMQEIERRYVAGESYRSILSSMGILD